MCPQIRIAPEPSAEDRDAILAALAHTLRRESALATPSIWRLAGWVDQRVGITDLGRWVGAERRWALATRLPRGGRTFPGLYGRGDAK